MDTFEKKFAKVDMNRKSKKIIQILRLDFIKDLLEIVQKS